MSDRLWIEDDAYGDATLWRDADPRDNYPDAIARECDVHPIAWRLIVDAVERQGAGGDTERVTLSIDAARQALAIIDRAYQGFDSVPLAQQELRAALPKSAPAPTWKPRPEAVLCTIAASDGLVRATPKTIADALRSAGLLPEQEENEE